jgi:16S rRNA processing protein RimM
LLTADDERRLTVRTLRHHGDRSIASFAEVEDRNAAEALRGTELVIPAERARALGAGEYWDHDLIGCGVVTTDGTKVGVVSDVLHQPANEVLVVSSERGDVLIPLVAAVVRGVEPGDRITIEPPPGLLAGE